MTHTLAKREIQETKPKRWQRMRGALGRIFGRKPAAKFVQSKVDIDSAHTSHMIRLNRLAEKGNLNDVSDALSNPTITLPNDETLYREEGAVHIVVPQETQNKMAKRFVQNIEQENKKCKKRERRFKIVVYSFFAATFGFPLSGLVIGTSAILPALAIWVTTAFAILSAIGVYGYKLDKSARLLINGVEKSNELSSSTEISEDARSMLRRVPKLVNSQNNVTTLVAIEMATDDEREEHVELRGLLRDNPILQPKELKI